MLLEKLTKVPKLLQIADRNKLKSKKYLDIAK